MATKRKRSPPKPPIDWYNIQTAKDALRWLRENGNPRWSQALELAKRFPEALVADSNYFGSDDGNTDLAMVSNYRVWKNEFEKSEGKIWWDLGGAILLRIDKDSPEKEAHDSLESDPVLDDSDHSELEWETQKENWESYGRDDLKHLIKSKAADSDEAAIESLLEFLSNSEFDEIVHEIWEADNAYPEQESGSSGTHFPLVLPSNWDGSLGELGKLFNLDKRGYYVEVKLTPAAYDRNNRIILRPVDLPDEKLLPLLISDEALYFDNYDQNICDSPYFVCGWVKKPPERQMRLPGVSEKQQRRRRAS